MDRTTAEEIATRLRQAVDECNASLRTVMRNDALGQAKVYGRLVGDFMGYSYTYVLAPLWKRFPELEPSDMKAAYVPPVASLSSESEEAVRAFLDTARAALDYLRANVATDDGKSTFGDGPDEIASAVSAIEAFLKHPRFHDSPPNGEQSA